MSNDYFQQMRLIIRNAWLCIVSWRVLGFAYFGIYLMLINLYLLRLGYGYVSFFLTVAILTAVAGAALPGIFSQTKRKVYQAFNPSHGRLGKEQFLLLWVINVNGINMMTYQNRSFC